MRIFDRNKIFSTLIVPQKLRIGLLLFVESLLLYLLTPNPIPEESDVIGGFLVNESPNLKYVTFWLLYVCLIIPSLPIQIRILNKISEFKKNQKNTSIPIATKEIGIFSKIEFELGYKLIGVLTIFLILGQFGMLVLHNFQTNRQLDQFSKNTIQDVSWLALFSIIAILIINLGTKKKANENTLKPSSLIRFQVYLPIIVIMTISLAGIRALRKLGLESYIANFNTLMVAILVFVAIYIRRLNAGKPLTQESVVLDLGFPATVALFLSQIPGQVTSSSVDPFEAYSFSNVFAWIDFSYMPWKDLLFNHGIYEDFLRPLFGTFVFGPTLWGMQAGILLIIVPFEFAFIYWGLGRIFMGHRSVVPVVSIFGLLIGFFPAVAPSIDNRLLIPAQNLPRILPLILFLAMYRTEFNHRLTKNFVLGLVLSISIIFAPDGLYLLGSFFIASLFRDLLIFRFKRSQATQQSRYRFQNIVDCIISVGVCCTLLICILQYFNLFKEFVVSLTVNSSGFLLQGGTGFAWSAGLPFLLTIGICVFTITFIFFEVSESLFLGNEKGEELSIVLIPVCIATILFAKFLLWPDWHILQVLASLTVPMYWIINRTINVRSSQNKNWIGISVALTISFLITQIPSQIQIKSGLTPNFSTTDITYRVGPSDQELNQRFGTIKALNQAAIEITGRSQPLVLDYSVTPADVYLFSNFRPVNNLLFVVTSFSDKSQKHYVEKFKQNPPDLVLWRGEIGLFNKALPGETYLRTYRISEYVLDHYRPAGVSGGYILLVNENLIEKGNVRESSIGKADLGSESCSWGDALERFKYPFDPISERISIPEKRTKVVKFSVSANSEKNFQIRAFGINRELMFSLNGEGKRSGAKAKELILPIALANELTYFEVNNQLLPYSFKQSRNLVTKDVKIKIENFNDKNNIFSTAHTIREYRGISYPTQRVEGSYTFRRITNSGETSFQVKGKSKKEKLEIPVANCPSLTTAGKGDSQYDQILLISKPKSNQTDQITLLR